MGALSKVERIKAASNHLRGQISEELAAASDAFSEDSAQVLKFHGVYQQDDRDRRKEARARGLDKHWMMMIRTRIPGGVVSPDGYLAHDRIAREWGNSTLRVTTRQDFQLHGVLKGDLKNSLKAINDALMTSLGGCGDQERNIMACPAPEGGRLREEVDVFLADLVRALTPSTGAYHEIWIDGEMAAGGVPVGEDEPLYGETYLPRKFKTAIAIEGDNCVDVYSNDLGLIAMRAPGGGLAGVNLLVGGGLGRTANKPDTFPTVALPLAFVLPDQAVAAARAVVTVQRDFGDRVNRRHARLKYLIHDRGVDWFRERVQERVDFPLRPARPLTWSPVDDHLGWHPQPNGNLYYGLYIENGRIKDEGEFRLLTALRSLVQTYRPRLLLTAQQNLILADLPRTGRGAVEATLRKHGVPLSGEISNTLRHSMGCPAYPTCGLAVAESERALPALIRRIEGVVAELGLEDERISYRMTGCPNGCARPYLGDVGFVGTTLGKYDVFLGGDFDGTRLNTLFAPNVLLQEIPDLLRGPLAAFAAERSAGEGFGDWCQRHGVATLRERFAESVA
ncbi:MAG: NADPH-dependent assimilatory sulfite reductase hemoprotein subunit [Chloroflexi bacterium]|nr:MAG: NADPH-dependent assimilatory sulfite reductase hemoprotein subunit [Chloroflexota bacterium]TME17940.1 MAG: NADPH-dependent assimilatory sulfite reductase hemoprotein subunit [Chloroflexota bacterium]